MYDNVVNYTCYFTSIRVMYIHGKDALLRIGDLKLSAIFCWIGGLTTASFSTLHILEYQVRDSLRHKTMIPEKLHLWQIACDIFNQDFNENAKWKDTISTHNSIFQGISPHAMKY